LTRHDCVELRAAPYKVRSAPLDTFTALTPLTPHTIGNI